MGSESPASRARYYLDKALFTLKRMIAEEPHNKEDIIEGSKTLKRLLSENYKVLGEDFCIEKGSEIEDMIRDYLKYEDPSLGDELK